MGKPARIDLDRLPPLERAVLDLRLCQELSVDEVGRRLGRSAAQIRELQHVALARLHRAGRTPVPAAGLSSPHERGRTRTS